MKIQRQTARGYAHCNTERQNYEWYPNVLMLYLEQFHSPSAKNFILINCIFFSDIAEVIKCRQSTQPLNIRSGQAHTTQICRVITQIYYRPTVAKNCPLI